MQQEKIWISGIPAILWGKASDKLYIHVHGKMSRKEYAESFAMIAEEKGYQTLSFDLPEHGERHDSACRCDIWNGMHDLNLIADYAYAHWSHVSLFACSLGAYFSLNTYYNRKLEKCLFQSPIVDMRWLVEHMMMWYNVTTEQLKAQGEIETPIDVLSWDYYQYIVAHPVVSWHPKTKILYAGQDQLQPLDVLQAFAERFDAELTVSPQSEHPFMAPADVTVVSEWLRKHI